MSKEDFEVDTKMVLEGHDDAKVEKKSLENTITPLHLAVVARDKSQVRKLIEDGTDVNVQDCYEETPLHYSSSADDIDIVEILLNGRANIYAKNRQGYTFLDLVILRDNFSLLENLILRKIVSIADVAKSKMCDLKGNVTRDDVLKFIEKQKFEKSLFDLEYDDYDDC